MTALAALAFLLGTSVARAECKPAAIANGDPALVQTLIERLSASGIETAPNAACPAVHVQVAQRGPQVHLRVTDAYERLGERDVQDVATAAAIIETWTLQEVDPGTLPPEAPAPTLIAPVTVSSTTGLALAVQSSLTEQSSTWIGGSLAGCMKVGWSCLGATVRAAKDTDATGMTSSGDHGLFELDALATGDVPRPLGRFVVSPGVALGYGWQRITSQHLDMHGLPYTLAESAHALRAGLHVRASRTVTSHVALYAELAGEGSLARTGITVGPTTAFGLSLGARFEVP